MNRNERYLGYRNQLEQTGEKLISLTDPDAKLMKTNDGFCVGYNTQVAVDEDPYMIAGYDVTNHPTDNGQLTKLSYSKYYTFNNYRNHTFTRYHLLPTP